MRVAHGCPILGCITFSLSTWARSPHQLVWTLQIPCAWWHRSFGTSAANHAWCTMMYHNYHNMKYLEIYVNRIFVWVNKKNLALWTSHPRTCWKWTMSWWRGLAETCRNPMPSNIQNFRVQGAKNPGPCCHPNWFQRHDPYPQRVAGSSEPPYATITHYVQNQHVLKSRWRKSWLFKRIWLWPNY